MPLYRSKIIDEIFSNLEKENKKIIIDALSGKEIYSFNFLEEIKKEAIFLQKNGFKKGDLAVIFLKNSIDFAKMVLSVILAGGKIAILDPEMGEKILAEKIKFLNPDFLFIEGVLYDILKVNFLRSLLKTKIKNIPKDVINIPRNIIINGFSLTGKKLEKLKNYKNINEKITFEYNDENEDAIIVFTGGTTQSPKGVIHSLSSINNTLLKIKDLIGNSKIFYADLPHFLLLGLICNILVISSRNDINEKKFRKILEKYKVDSIFSPPSKFINFIQEKQYLPKTLVKILLGSAPIYKSFLLKLKNITKAEILCIYGMTEILPVSFISGDKKIKNNILGDDLGKIIAGVEYKIIKNELYLKGENLFKNYLGNQSEEWHKTGDLVKIENESLVMIGRKKDMIIRKDYNIYPSIFESIISEIPGIKSCAFIGVYEKKIEDEKVILFIEIEKKIKNYDEKCIKNLLKKGKFSIDKYALPDEIIFTKIPTIGRQNKIDKRKLKEIYLHNEKIGKLQ